MDIRKEVADGIGLVRFTLYDLEYIDLEQKTLQTINPRSARGCHPCLGAGHWKNGAPQRRKFEHLVRDSWRMGTSHIWAAMAIGSDLTNLNGTPKAD